jgi:hypothetical protein
VKVKVTHQLSCLENMQACESHNYTGLHGLLHGQLQFLLPVHVPLVEVLDLRQSFFELTPFIFHMCGGKFSELLQSEKGHIFPLLV